MKRKGNWNFIVTILFVTVVGVIFSMCRSAPKQNYRGWTKHPPEDYPMAPPPFFSNAILPPFCNKFFHEEDVIHYFPASGGFARIQYNPEIDYLSASNACVSGAVQRLVYTKSRFGDIELQRDTVIPGDVYCCSDEDSRKRWKQRADDPWIKGGGRYWTERSLQKLLDFTAGEDHWVECRVNGDKDLVSIIVMPNKTGRLRVMTIVFTASYGSIEVSDHFVNNAIYIIQSWD